jgi:hypothetical protein
MKGSGLGAAMAGGNPGVLADVARERSDDDFYATPNAATHALALRYQDYLANAWLWEPCAGDGRMGAVLIDYLQGVGTYLLTDIQPRAKPVSRYSIFNPAPDTDVTAVITNPPYNIAARIIAHTLQPGHHPRLRIFALLLKSTFYHAAGRHSLFRQHPPSMIHPLTWRLDFMGLGRPTMECAWFVWLPEANTAYGDTRYVPLDHPGEQYNG